MIDSTDIKLLDAADAEARLRAAGVKVTSQRVDIARILFSCPQHLSADQVLGRMRTLGQDCSRATVYNTLGLFKECGLVREVMVDPARVLYDSTPGPHHHIFNEDTGALIDIDANAVRLAALPALPEGTELAGADVIVRVRKAR